MRRQELNSENNRNYRGGIRRADSRSQKSNPPKQRAVNTVFADDNSDIKNLLTNWDRKERSGVSFGGERNSTQVQATLIPKKSPYDIHTLMRINSRGRENFGNYQNRDFHEEQNIDTKKDKIDLSDGGIETKLRHIMRSEGTIEDSLSLNFGISDQYMVLDSFLKSGDSDVQNGRFVYNLMIQGSTREDAIGIVDKLDYIIEIEVYPFCGPIPTAYPYVTNNLGQDPNLPRLVANPTAPAGAGNPFSPDVSQMPFCNRVTMYIEEIGRQSFLGARGRRHHFEFDVSLAPTGDRAIYTPVEGQEKFIFTDPIQAIDGVTLQFYNPLEQLQFPIECPERIIARVVAVGPDRFLEFDTLNSHDLANDDRIYIDNLQTGNSIIDDWVNRSIGHNVTISTLNTFRLNPDVDVVTLGIAAGNPIPSSLVNPVKICIAKFRMRIPLRMRRLLPKITQRIVPQ